MRIRRGSLPEFLRASSALIIHGQQPGCQNYSGYNGCSSLPSMKRFSSRVAFAFALVLALSALALTRSAIHNESPQEHSSSAPKAKADSTFFPVSVWYSGGKARAPMLETIAPVSAGLWKEDLLKIRSLGF